MLSSCSLYKRIPALIPPPFTQHEICPLCSCSSPWRNNCSHAASCMDESLLFSCSLQGEISALIMLTVLRNVLYLPAHSAWRNTCSHPALCMEEGLISSCSLHGKIPVLILLTAWKNTCSNPAHCMEIYLL
jgi:hypothetical protein